MNNLPDKSKISSLIKDKQKDLQDLLTEFIAIPSVSGEASAEQQIQTLIEDRLRSIGCKIDKWEPNLEELQTHPAYIPTNRDYVDRPIVVGILKGSDRGKSIILNGHVDVVSPGPISAWTHNPWTATSRDDKIFGRGAADMKGGLASLLVAMESLVECDCDLAGDIIFESVLDEEPGGNGTLACVMRGYKGDAAIIAEPTDLEIQPAQKGARFFTIKTKGKAAHAGVKYEGVSALEKSMLILDKLKIFENEREKKATHRLYRKYKLKVPINIGKIYGGEWPSMVPEEITMEGVFECQPGENVFEISRALEEQIKEATISDPWMRKNPPKVEFPSLLIEPSEIDTKHPFISSVKKSYREVMNEDSVISGFPAGCDMRLLVNYASTPTIILGPGSLKQAHSTDEFISKKELLLSTRVYAFSILDWCS